MSGEKRGRVEMNRAEICFLRMIGLDSEFFYAFSYVWHVNASSGKVMLNGHYLLYWVKQA